MNPDIEEVDDIFMHLYISFYFVLYINYVLSTCG